MATRPKRGASRTDGATLAMLRDRSALFNAYRDSFAALGAALADGRLDLAAQHAAEIQQAEADLRAAADPRLGALVEALQLMRAAVIDSRAELERDIGPGAPDAGVHGLDRAIDSIRAAQLAAISAEPVSRIIAAALRNLLPCIGPLVLWHGWPTTKFGPALAGIASDRLH